MLTPRTAARHSASQAGGPVRGIGRRRVPLPYLHRTVGNQAVLRLVDTAASRSEARVSRPGDVLEREADRAGRQVVRLPGPPTGLAAAGAGTGDTGVPPAGRVERAGAARRLGSGRPLDAASSSIHSAQHSVELSGISSGTGACGSGPAGAAGVGACCSFG